jgi:hemerythrin
MTNQLHRLIRLVKVDRNLYAYILGSLIEFSCTHFENEEKLMKMFIDIDDDSIIKHKREHNAFRDKMEDFYRRHKENDMDYYEMELLNYLTEWIMSHVLVQDKYMTKRMKRAQRKEKSNLELK